MDGIGDFLGKVKKEVNALLGNEGKDRTYHSEHKYPDRATAEAEFSRSVTKLFDVNGWSDLDGFNSHFEVFTPSGKPKPDSPLQVGDYIQIQLPGPWPPNWVEVTDLRTQPEEAEFTVRPSGGPEGKEDPDSQTKHFFTRQATSTFRVSIQDCTLAAFEIGRHEVINNQGPQAGERALVNTAMAEGGWAGVQALQWNKLTDYWVHLS